MSSKKNKRLKNCRKKRRYQSKEVADMLGMHLYATKGYWLKSYKCNCCAYWHHTSAISIM